jgi:predicted kinase
MAPEIIDNLDSNMSVKDKKYILRLINYHQILFGVSKTMSDKALKKLSDKFSDVFLLNDLMTLRTADFSGNISKSAQSTDASKVNELIELVEDNFLKYHKTTLMDTSLPVMTILVGLPGCGKDHYAKNMMPDTKTLSRDDILMNLSELGDSYSQAFAKVDQGSVDRVFEEKFKHFLNLKEDFIINRTNLSHKGRMKFLSRAKGFKTKIIVFLPEIQTVMDRNAYRIRHEGKEIPWNIVKRMMESFDMPFDNEGQVEYYFNY